MKPKKARLARLQQHLKPEYVYLVLGLVFGLLAVFFNPPYESPDENNHFVRAYQISDGVFIPRKENGWAVARVPISLAYTLNSRAPTDKPMLLSERLNNINKLRKIQLNPKEKTQFAVPATGLYSPVAYFPQVIGILIGKMFGNSPIAIFFLARFAGLIGSLFLILNAIRIAAWGKWTFVAIGLLPMTVYLSGAITSDSFTIATTIFMAALLTRAHFELNLSQTLPKKLQVAIAITALALGLLKLPYFLVVLVALFIAYESRARRYALSRAAILVTLSLVVVGIWSKMSKHLFATHPWGPSAEGFVSPDFQFAFVLHHPVQFMQALGNTYITSFGNDILRQVTGAFGWLTIYMPIWVTVMIGALFLYLIIFDTDSSIGRLTKTGSWLLFVGGVGTVGLLLYMSWTFVGSKWISGIQGRYLIPLLALLPFMGNLRKPGLNQGINPVLVTSLLTIALLAGASVIMVHYYAYTAYLHASPVGG